jgi:hypothetical protein
MKITYTVPADQENTLIPVGIYSAKCISVVDSTSHAGNAMTVLECQVSTMKLDYRLTHIDSVLWKTKQVRRAFGFVDPSGELIDFDTADFIGREAQCLVGYAGKIAKSGTPYIDLVEFIEPGKEEQAATKLAQIIKSEADRKRNADELDAAGIEPF